MKLKRGRHLEVPPKVGSFINSVKSVPLENIEEPLKDFIWDFDKGDFNHWVDLFNHFDTFFEKHIKSRKDLLVDDNILESDPPFPRDAVLQILRVIRLVLENCTNKHFYISYEHHLSSLLASTDADVVEACLQTLTAFLKKAIGKYSIRGTSLNSKLFSLAQGWGGKEEGLGLIACAVQNGCDTVAYDLGCTLHFEFYQSNDFSASEQSTQGLQIIHLPNVNSLPETDLELLNKLVVEYKVPTNLRFSLLSRLRYARAFGTFTSRQQYTRIRLYAFIVLVQARSDTDDLVSFFNNEPEFVNELVTLLSYEDVPEKIRILCVLSLVALCQDWSRQSTVLTAVTSGGHGGILYSLTQKAIDSVISNTSRRSIVFAEVLLSLVIVLVSSSSGCSAMREAGFIPTLLPLLKDIDPQHLQLVSTAVNILEAFMDYSNSAAALFRDLGGLDDTISRLKLEVSYVESSPKQQVKDPGCSERSSQVVAGASTQFDSMQPLYSEALVSYQRRVLMKALLRAISPGVNASGNTARVYGSEESLLPQCLCIIFRQAKDFGGGLFALAANVMSDLIHKDPTCFPALDAAGLPSAFLDAIMNGVLCSTEAITCIPQCLDALCLNTNGLEAVKDRKALSCFVKIFTSRTYLRSLTGDTPGSLSSGLDELMRHASSLRGSGVDMVIEILNVILRIGSGVDTSYLASESSFTIPMETDAVEMNSVEYDGVESSRIESPEQTAEPSSDTSMNIELFLPDCISNVGRLLETILQNAETGRLFVEKKGVDAVLQFFTLPLMPLPASIGKSISVAFKNFSLQHSATLARAVCSFLREHLKSTNELLASIGGAQLAAVESGNQTKVLRSLSSLEGILCLSNFLLKSATTNVISELHTADDDIWKDLGRTYREIIWQISLSNDSMADEKHNADQESESTDTAPSTAATGRESDDDASSPVVRYMNPVSVRSGSQSLRSSAREYLSLLRSPENFHSRHRHGLSRLRGGRNAWHFDALNIDSEVSHHLPYTSSVQNMKTKSPDLIVIEILNKLAFTLRSFFTALVKAFTPSNRRRTDGRLMSSASKTLGMALAKIFLEALGFSRSSSSSGLDSSLSVKCRYLGKTVDDMGALTFDSRRRICYTAMVNNFYVHGTFKELLTTFGATNQLLWTLPYSSPTLDIEHEKAGETKKFSHSQWLLDTLQCYCRVLEYFVNSKPLLFGNSASLTQSQTQLLLQPVASGLSIGLFPVPKDPETFVRMLQCQVLDVILPIWNHPLFPNCSPGFLASVVSIVMHIYSGVGDVNQNVSSVTGRTNQHFMLPPLDEGTVATIVEMGFSRARAEEALRRAETNSVETAMEWLFSHAEDPVQEDDGLAQALALSLGNSSETSKVDTVDKAMAVMTEEGQPAEPPIDDILGASVKLFQSSDNMAYSLTDFLVTLCNRKKGEDCPRVLSFLIQQLKLCPLEFSKDCTALCTISHIVALLLSEDGNTREIASQNGIVPAAIDILSDFKAKNELGNKIMAPKCISALLLILDNMLQSRSRIFSEKVEGMQMASEPESNGEHATLSVPESPTEKNTASDANVKESISQFEKILGKSTGYLTMEESHKLLLVACDLIKQHVPAMVMQAVLQLCARLTKTNALALQFLENGSLAALLSLPRACIFPGYDTVASAIIRHLLEDPQTLQTAIELQIRQTLSGSRHAGRLSLRNFLTSMAPVICRDPVVFMKASAAVCQLEPSGGRPFVALLKEKERDKDKLKASGAEFISSSNEPVQNTENKVNDGTSRCSKGQKRVSVILAQVIDQLLEIVLGFPSAKCLVDSASELTSMEIDEPASKLKGKSKVEETSKMESETERSAVLAKVTFVLKFLSDILLMHVHAVGVILKRDSEMGQLRGSNQMDASRNPGILYHILHRLLPVSANKLLGSDEWREKLSEKASWFLVVLCGRSSEGRKRVVNELVKALSLFPNLESNSMKSSLVPDKRVFAFADLTYSILSKNSSSGNLPGTGCSPDIAKSLIQGGVVQCLTNILEVIDLDHPDAPKFVNLMLKALESLTRAANANEQIFKSEGSNKKKSFSSNGRLADQVTESEVIEHNQNGNGQQIVVDEVNTEQQQHLVTAQSEGNHNATANPNDSIEQDMRVEVEETEARNRSMELEMDFMNEEIEGGVLNNTDQIEMTFQVESREVDDLGDEDDNMADDGEDDEDDDEGEEEEEEYEDIAEDGDGMMSLVDTDVEDNDDTGLGDDYNADMIDEEDDDFHEHQIEVGWGNGFDGLDHLPVFRPPGTASALIDVTSEPFEGVNVDDLFGLSRPVGLERRRFNGRSSFERSFREVNGFQHPLLLRPSQSGDLRSMWSSGGNTSRDLEVLSSGSSGVTHFHMFDAPVLPYDHGPGSVFGDRLGSTAPPPLSDYSVGMETMHLRGRRGPGDGWWTDDGQPLASTQAAAIAQAVEEQFVSHLRSTAPANNLAERQPQNSEIQERQQLEAPPLDDGNAGVDRDNGSCQQSEDQQQENGNDIFHELNPRVESVSCHEQVNSQSVIGDMVESVQSHEEILTRPVSFNNALNEHDNMETGEGNVNAADQVEFISEMVNLPEGGCSAPRNLLLPMGADRLLGADGQSGNTALADSGLEMPNFGDSNGSSLHETVDVEMNTADSEQNQTEQSIPPEISTEEPVSGQNTLNAQDASHSDQTIVTNEASGASAIDPTFLEALPEDLRAEVLASQQAQSVQPPAYVPPSANDIDPEFLAALPPDIQAEVLAQQRAQRVVQQVEGQPVDMDNASIIATFPADLREEVLLTSSEAVLSALPSPLMAEAQMLRDRAMSHYQAHSLFGGSHRLNNRWNGLGLNRQTVVDRGVGVTLGQRPGSTISDSLKVKEIEGKPLLNANSLKALIRLLRLAQPLGKGLLQRLLLNLCAHSVTRASLVKLLLDIIRSETEGSNNGLSTINSLRLYGCQSNVVYGRSQWFDGLPPLVLRRVLEILSYLATNHSSVANMLFYYDPSILSEPLSPKNSGTKKDKGKEKIMDGVTSKPLGYSQDVDIPFILLLKLLNRLLFLRSTAHLEQVVGLLQVVVDTAASKLASQTLSDLTVDSSNSHSLLTNKASGDAHEDPHSSEPESNQEDKHTSAASSALNSHRTVDMYDIFMQLPEADLQNLCSLLGHEGLSDKVYMLAGEVLKKVASVGVTHRKFFTSEFSELANGLSSSAVNELVTLRNTQMLGLTAGSMAGAAILRVLKVLSSLTSTNVDDDTPQDGIGEQEEEQAIMSNLNVSLEPLWEELSNCIGVTEAQLMQNSVFSTVSNVNVGEHAQGTSSSSPLPPGTQKLLPFIEAFFALCEKLHTNHSILQQDHANVTAREIKEFAECSASLTSKCGGDFQKKLDGSVTFARFAEKHRRLLNVFVRQSPSLLEKSLSMLLKAPRLIDFDNKRAHFRSRIKKQHEQHLAGPLQISVRRAYVLEDSYNQLRSTQNLKGRLNVQFQGEEGIDAGGLTREWYQLLSRVIFDKGALLFTTVGNSVTFQPNPNSVYQIEHLSYFKFVGRVVAKALFDGQLLDVYFTRSFYKHILGVKVTYHDIEAVDPDYYKNLKWMLENDVSDIPDLTFSMDADEEKHILYEKTEVTGYELKPDGRNIRVTEETKHEYVDLVAGHILTNAIRPQINSFLEGFNELVPRELISIFNDKELELLISGLPEIDLDDLKANTDYTGYTAVSPVIQWFWEVVKAFNKEDMARLLQFVTGTSKVPLEGFKALQGISGPQRFQIHKAYGAPVRLPSAHTCFNQLDLPEYSSKEQLQERLLLAIHEASEGFGFG